MLLMKILLGYNILVLLLFLFYSNNPIRAAGNLCPVIISCLYEHWHHIWLGYITYFIAKHCFIVNITGLMRLKTLGCLKLLLVQVKDT